MIYSSHYGVTKSGEDVTLFTLTNAKGYQIEVINYGCTIVAIRLPDRQGEAGNIVLSYESLEEYENGTHYAGGIIGRNANRVKNARFKLQDNIIELSRNQNEHHLHGGHRGFDKVVWQAKAFENEDGIGVDFQYLSADGEEGYPGNLSVMVRYFLTDDALQLMYAAKSDADTIVNLTQHTYFNMNAGGNILTHQLLLNADHVVGIDDKLIPTGELIPVENTAFDFRSFKSIDTHIRDEHLLKSRGYDHCFVLNKSESKLSYAATLYAGYSGRKLDIFTTEPGVQLYTGNDLDFNHAANLKGPYCSLCLETQHFPDAINHAGFPSTVLHPDEIYQSMTILNFTTIA